MMNLLDKYKSRIPKIPDKLELDKLDNKKIFLIVLICSVIVYIDFTFVIKLQLRGMRNLTPKIVTLRKDIDKLAKDLATLQDLKNRQAETKQKIGATKLKEIISDDEIPLLLQVISDVAHKNKVKIMQINTARDAKAQEETIAGEKLVPITIKLDLSCTYHSLGSFINALENARQFIELQEMKIMRNPGDYFLENVTLVLKTYVKK